MAANLVQTVGVDGSVIIVDIWDVLDYAAQELLDESSELWVAGEITTGQHNENIAQINKLISHWHADEEAAWAAVKEYEPAFVEQEKDKKAAAEVIEREEYYGTEVKTESYGELGEFKAVIGLREYAMDAADEFALEAYGYGSRDQMEDQIDGQMKQGLDTWQTHMHHRISALLRRDVIDYGPGKWQVQVPEPIMALMFGESRTAVPDPSRVPTWMKRDILASDWDELVKLARAIKNADAGIAQFTLNESVVAWRGLAASAVEGLDVGDVVVDQSFMSTAFIKEVSDDFAFRVDAVVKILIPAGTKSFYYAGRSESEIVLPRNTVLRLVSKEDGLLTFIVEGTYSDEGF